MFLSMATNYRVIPISSSSSMQNSEIFRRGVVLPLNLEAEERLRINDAMETTPVRYLEIEDQVAFDLLWKTGIFQQINGQTKALIDDYEEGFVEACEMSDVLDAIRRTRDANKAGHIVVVRFLDSLSSLASEAAVSGRPLLFVL